MVTRSAAAVAAALAVAALGAIGSTGCGGGEAADSLDGGAAAVVERGLEVELVARRRADDAGDTVPLFRAADLIGWGDTLLVVDGGNDRLVLLDPSLEVIGSIGRRGAGPDELERPFSITQWPGGFVVGDQGNTRFAMYGRDGVFRTTLASPRVPMSFAADSRGELYLPMYLPDTYLLRVDERGRMTPFGERPGEPRLPPSEESPPVTFDFVAVTAGDTVHVLDNQRGSLLKYSPNGHLLLERPLPGVVPAEIAKRAELERRRFGALFAGGFARKMTVTRDGRLLILLNADGVWAALLDPRDYAGTLLRLPEAQPAQTLFRTAYAAYYAPPSLFVLADDDVVHFRVTDPPPP